MCIQESIVSLLVQILKSLQTLGAQLQPLGAQLQTLGVPPSPPPSCKPFNHQMMPNFFGCSLKYLAAYWKQLKMNFCGIHAHTTQKENTGLVWEPWYTRYRVLSYSININTHDNNK